MKTMGFLTLMVLFLFAPLAVSAQDTNAPAPGGCDAGPMPSAEDVAAQNKIQGSNSYATKAIDGAGLFPIDQNLIPETDIDWNGFWQDWYSPGGGGWSGGGDTGGSGGGWNTEDPCEGQTPEECYCKIMCKRGCWWDRDGSEDCLIDCFIDCMHEQTQ